MASGKRRHDYKSFSQRLEELAAVIEGQLVRPDGGAEAGAAMPSLIVRCARAEDVAASVRSAQDYGLPINVGDGSGIVLDLSPMKRVEVEARARQAHVQAGATVADVDRATQRYGLATPTGLPSTANVVALTMNDSIGWLRRLYGTSRENVLALEMVTADGRVEAQCGAAEDGKEMLLQRAGKGVVTALTLRLYPVGPEVVMLTTVYALSLARPALYAWRDWTRTAPREASTDFFFWNVPAAPPFPSSLHNRSVVIVAGLFVGSVQEGLSVFRPLRDVGRRLIDLTGPAPYVAAQRTFDSFLPEGMHLNRQWRLPCALDNETVEGILAVAQRRSRHTLVSIHHVGEARGWSPKVYLLSVTPIADEDEEARRLWRELASL